MSETSKHDGINQLVIRPDGPLVARGEVSVLASDGRQLAAGEDIALCRCGASRNKPFCDGSHKEVGFTDAGQFEDARSEALQGHGPLVIECRDNAMLLARGPMQIISRDGQSMSTRNKAALCRCGHSANKPFCDAKHKQQGFCSE